MLSRTAFELTFAARAAAAGVTVPADLVITVVPALLSVLAARLIARRHHAPLGIIVQDLMGSAALQSGLRGGQLVSRVSRRIEANALNAADSVCTIHPRLAGQIEQHSRRPPSIVYNWTHIAHRPRPGNSLRQQMGWRDDEVIALHSGNMGAKQNLEVVIDAARLAEQQGQRVRFVLAGGGNQRDKLKAYARGCDRLSFVDSVEDEQYMDLLASADVLVVNERPGMNEMSIPSKLTSYLVAGRPIVAATDSHSGTAEFVRATGGGIITPAGDAAALLASVRTVARDSQLSSTLTSAGRAFAEEHLSPAGALADYEQWVDDLLKLRS